MNIDFFKILDLPIVVIDDFYNDIEQQLIWQELLFLNVDGKLLPGHLTGSAEDDQGRILKNNLSLHLDSAFAGRRELSNIMKVNRKLFEKQLMAELIKYHYFFKYLEISNKDTTLISYYEHNDYYKSHFDESIVTSLTWFYKEPRKFTGGNLNLENQKDIECKHNRMIVFPSVIQHSVENVFMQEIDKNKNLGRFTITQFILRQ